MTFFELRVVEFLRHGKIWTCMDLFFLNIFRVGLRSHSYSLTGILTYYIRYWPSKSNIYPLLYEIHLSFLISSTAYHGLT